MCQSIWADRKQHISNIGELAAWLGIPASELTFREDYGDDIAERADNCLCPVDIEYTLDRFKVWHRRDIDGDSMRTFAIRDATLAAART